MAQSRNEIRTDLIKGTECLEGNGKEMIFAGDVGVFIFFALGRRLLLLLFIYFAHTQCNKQVIIKHQKCKLMK